MNSTRSIFAEDFLGRGGDGFVTCLVNFKKHQRVNLTQDYPMNLRRSNASQQLHHASLSCSDGSMASLRSQLGGVAIWSCPRRPLLSTHVEGRDGFGQQSSPKILFS